MKLYKHMQPIEVAIISFAVSMLREHGFHPLSVDDGEEVIAVNEGSLNDILSVVNSVEESTITFKGPKGELPAVHLVLGNGCDIVSNWMDLPGFTDVVDTAIAAFGEAQDLYRWGFWGRWPEGLRVGLPEVYSKRVDEHGDLKVGEVTIKLWLAKDQTLADLAKWVDGFLADLDDHPARDGEAL